MADLLPCPFCGNDKDIGIANERHDLSGGYFIACPKCDASTGLRFACGDDPTPLLVEQWNRRATAPTQDVAAPEAAQLGLFFTLDKFPRFGLRAVYRSRPDTGEIGLAFVAPDGSVMRLRVSREEARCIRLALVEDQRL